MVAFQFRSVVQAISAPKGRRSPSPGQRPGEPCRDTNAIGPTGQRFSFQSQPQATQIVCQRKRLARWAEKCSVLAYHAPGRCPGLGEPRAFGPATYRVSRKKTGILPTRPDPRFWVSFSQANASQAALTKPARLVAPKGRNISAQGKRSAALGRERKIRKAPKGRNNGGLLLSFLYSVAAAIVAMACGCRPAAKAPPSVEENVAQRSASQSTITSVVPHGERASSSPAGATGNSVANTGFHEAPGTGGRGDREATACPIRFVDVTAASGITFEHVDGSSGRHYIVEAMSSGVATFDYDRDGLIDIYFPNGALLPGATRSQPPRHALYRNLGGLRFRDVSEHAGVACTAFGLGIAVADYDNDGWPDIYLNNFGPNILYHNNGDGTFTDVTAHAEVAGTAAGGDLRKKVGAGACFFDMDGNGRLDLYAGNYLELDLAAHVPRLLYGMGVYHSPLEYTPGPGTLYRNNGDGTFSNISRESGIAAHAGRNMGMVAADYDNDGNTDLFVCNDIQPNFLFHNDGRGRFEEVAMVAGAAVNFNGEHLANMGADCGDYNNDGQLDFYTTNYQGESKMLLHNLGDVFEDRALRTGAGAGCYSVRQLGMWVGRFRQRRPQGHFRLQWAHRRQHRAP